MSKKREAYWAAWQRRRRSASVGVLITISNLTAGNAVAGTHASITMSASSGTISARKWGSTLGGSEYGTGTSPTDFAAGEGSLLYATATVDGQDYTATALIVDAPAVNTVAPAVTGDTGYADVLSTTNGTWTGAVGGAYSYQWQRNGVDIAGATSSSYMLTVADSGATIRAIVTYTNSGGPSSATSNEVTADTLTTAAVAANLAISGTTTVGQTLSLTGGAVTGNPTPTVTYQWLRGGVAISGATSATYTLVEADDGENISCTKSATNVIGSGSDTSDAVGPIAAAPSGETSLTTGSVGWSWTTERTTGTDATGRPYVVVPTGTETFNQPTPAQSTADGAWSNATEGDVIGGVMVNPERTNGGNSVQQGWDERVARYSAALNEDSATFTVSAGDTLTKGVPIESSRSQAQSPVFTELQSLHVVASAPGTNDVLGPVADFTQKSGLPATYTVDWGALVARCGSLNPATYGHTVPPYATVMASLEKPAFAYGITSGDNQGYEPFTPIQWDQENDKQIGGIIEDVMGTAIANLHFSTWTTEQKTNVLKKIVMHGIEWGFPIVYSSHKIFPAGQHHQFWQGATIIALEACGLSSKIPTFLADTIGGNWDALFKITNTLITSDFSGHTAASDKPVFWNNMTLAAQPGGTTLRIPAQGELLTTGQVEIMAGARVYRGGTHVATVTARVDIERNTTTDVTIDAQPTPAFASSDVITFDSPPNHLFHGAYDWSQRSGFSAQVSTYATRAETLFSQSATNNYRDSTQQRMGGSILGVAAMGLLHPNFDGQRGYLEYTRNGDRPSASNAYPRITPSWNPSGTTYDLIDVFGDDAAMKALLYAQSDWETTNPTALNILEVNTPDNDPDGSDNLVDATDFTPPSGLTEMPIRISGSATGGDNSWIEVRVLKDSDSSVVFDWYPIAQISSGDWDGTIFLPADAATRYTVEARALRDVSVSHAPTETFGVGFASSPPVSPTVTYMGTDMAVNPGVSSVSHGALADAAATYIVGVNTRETNGHTSVTLAGVTATAISTNLVSPAVAPKDRLQFFEVTTLGSGNLVINYGANPVVSEGHVWKVTGYTSTGLVEASDATDTSGDSTADLVSVPDGAAVFVIANRNNGGSAVPLAGAGFVADAATKIGSTSYSIHGRSVKSGAGNLTVTVDWVNSTFGAECMLAIALPVA